VRASTIYLEIQGTCDVDCAGYDIRFLVTVKDTAHTTGVKL